MDSMLESVLFDHVNVAVAFFDEEGLLTRTNTAWEMMWANNTGDELILTYDDLVRRFSLDHIETSWMTRVTETSTSNRRLLIRRQRIKRDNCSGIMVEIDNLTSKAKKMEHANRLFSDAMWKIRSRISSVQNVLTLFTDYQNEGIDEELLMLLKKTRREMWEMMRHAENLRFLSVVDLGAVSLEPHLHSYHIREMVDSVVVACGILISAEEGVVTVNVDIDRELAVITDRQIMGKVISVLLFNAIEYNEGEITVTVKAEVREDGTVLTVTDNGWGIPDEEQEKIFTYAFRGSAAKKVPGSGAGVELYLARKLLMKIGGDLQFISKENHGSTFTITLREPENAEE